MTIFLVDPDPTDRQRVREMLRAAVPEALLEGDGSDLDDALTVPDLRLVLLEQRLAGTTGLQVLERLRRQRPEVGVIMVTRHGDEETAVTGLKTGLLDYIPKGRLERLLPAVRQALASPKPGLLHGLSPRGRRLDSVAHDLNNALTPIRLGADLLGRVRDEAARRTLADSIIAGVHRCVALLRGLPELGAAAPAEPVPPAGRGQLVLLAAEERGCRDLARTALESNGYRVLTAGNGAEVLALHEQHRRHIAAIILDLALPVLDGIALVRALRATDASVPILPACGVPPEQALLDELGLRAFLLEPYTGYRLLDALHGLLSPRERSEES
jgi:DNA-binding response OmpR family regulator